MIQVSSRKQLHFIINQRGYKVGVEIGVDKGEYTEYLLENTNAFIYGVDCWQHVNGYVDVANISNEEHYQNMMKAHNRLSSYIMGGRCQLAKEFSVEFAKEFKDGSVDFAYIDANHREPDVLSDMNAWYPKVRKGGMMAGHDYMDGLYLVGDELSEFGVISAVTKFLSNKHYRIFVTNELWPTWYFMKE